MKEEIESNESYIIENREEIYEFEKKFFEIEYEFD